VGTGKFVGQFHELLTWAGGANSARQGQRSSGNGRLRAGEGRPCTAGTRAHSGGHSGLRSRRSAGAGGRMRSAGSRRTRASGTAIGAPHEGFPHRTPHRGGGAGPASRWCGKRCDYVRCSVARVGRARTRGVLRRRNAPPLLALRGMCWHPSRPISGR